MTRRLAAGLVLGLVASTLALGAGLLPFVDVIERKLYDLRVRYAADPASARRDIAVVAIDELSVRRLDPAVGRWPWPRLVHAAVIDYLKQAGARLVVYDVLFTEQDRRGSFEMAGTTWSGRESDDAFADAVAAAGNVVLPADATFEGLVDPAANPPAPAAGSIPGLPEFRLARRFEPRPVLTLPYARLAGAARAIGHNLFVLDADGPVRRMLPFVRVGDRFVPSLSMAAVFALAGVSPAGVRDTAGGLSVGDRELPLVTYEVPRHAGASVPAPDERFGRAMLISFRGPAVLADGRSTTYPQYSFADVLVSADEAAAGTRPTIEPAAFKDRVVIVGTTAAGLHDVFTVPFGEGAKMPGPLVHAAAIDQVLSNRFVRPFGRIPTALLVAAIALALGLTFTVAGLQWGLASTVIALVATAWSGLFVFRSGTWIPLAVPIAAIAAVAFGGVAFHYLIEGREKRAVKRLFSRYLSRDVYEQLLANPSLAELGGRRRDMTVLFSDVRGFTALTEKGDPEAIVAQLNEYFSRMVDVVFAHRGTLDKFVGDMVMALFGAPLDDPDHAEHAVQAALEMVDVLADLNGKWASEGRPTLGIGIGISSGDMIAGNIGSARVQSYTVIGDAVNLGARLETLNKDYGTAVIISEATASRLQARYDLRPLGEVVVKGKTRPVGVFEIRRTAAVQGNIQQNLAAPEESDGRIVGKAGSVPDAEEQRT